jgi:His/Glu/Gln/Arg/opine family amino acid ABC transporter permease subunit
VSLLATYPWHWQVIWEDHHLQYLLGGIKMTVILAATTFFSGMALAVPIAAARLSRFRALRWTSYVYVELFRTVPLLLGILWVYYALPSLLSGLTLTAFLSAYLFFTLNIAAIVSEALRAGMLALGHGQRWAAASLGMKPWQVFYRVLMPQAFRRVIPVLGSVWVALFKDTSLVFVIAISEITYRSNKLAIQTYRQLEIYTATMILYFLITWPQARVVDRLYERYRTHE